MERVPFGRESTTPVVVIPKPGDFGIPGDLKVKHIIPEIVPDGK
jgi:hypothetical protein